MKITMQQIAEKAGVTRATVDKVIHNRPGVNPATRERIKQIAAEYNYQPTSHAKSLVHKTKSIRLAIVTLPPSHDYYMSEIKAGMDYQLNLYQDLGFQADYYYCDTTNPQSILSIISYLETQKIDALAIRGIDYPGVTQYINSLSAKQIPVITFDSDLPNSDRLCFIGENLHGTGQIAASLMAKSIGRKGQIAILGSSMNTNSTSERISGFTAYMNEEYPDVEIVEIIETLDQHAITYTKVCEVIKQYPNLRGIWNAVSCCEDMAQAVIDSKKVQQIALVSLTFSPTIISLIKQDIIDFTLGLTPGKLGKIVIQTLYEYLYLNKQPPSRHIQTPIYIALKANIDSFDHSFSFK